MHKAAATVRYATGVGSRLKRVAGALGAVLAVTLAFQVIAVANATTVGFAYLVAILLVAAAWGLTESVIASIAATIGFSYFFLPPLRTFAIADPENWIALFTFLISALIASQLSDRAKRRTIEARTRQIEMERLYALSRAIMLMNPEEPVGSYITREIARVCEIPAVALYDRTNESIYYEGEADLSYIQSKLRDVALTVSPWKDDQAGTLFTPISLGGQCIGSIAIREGIMSDPALHALLNLIAITLESSRSREIAMRAQAARQSEEFKSTLLDGLAHEFKTPLTSIKAAASALLASTVSDVEHRHELLTIVDQEAERLSRLVTGATHLARVEAGKIQLDRQMHSVESLIAGAVEEMEPRLDGRLVQIVIQPHLPDMEIDLQLMQLALRQLLDNAVKYSPQQSPIRVGASAESGQLLIKVQNEGEALAKSEQLRVFDKFYRGVNVRSKVAGTGMGLSIARDIVVAHGGDLRLDRSTERGTQFVLSMPVHTKVAL